MYNVFTVRRRRDLCPIRAISTCLQVHKAQVTHWKSTCRLTCCAADTLSQWPNPLSVPFHYACDLHSDSRCRSWANFKTSISRDNSMKDTELLRPTARGRIKSTVLKFASIRFLIHTFAEKILGELLTSTQHTHTTGIDRLTRPSCSVLRHTSLSSLHPHIFWCPSYKLLANNTEHAFFSFS